MAVVSATGFQHCPGGVSAPAALPAHRPRAFRLPHRESQGRGTVAAGAGDRRMRPQSCIRAGLLCHSRRMREGLGHRARACPAHQGRPRRRSNTQSRRQLSHLVRQHRQNAVRRRSDDTWQRASTVRIPVPARPPTPPANAQSRRPQIRRSGQSIPAVPKQAASFDRGAPGGLVPA